MQINSTSPPPTPYRPAHARNTRKAALPNTIWHLSPNRRTTPQQATSSPLCTTPAKATTTKKNTTQTNEDGMPRPVGSTPGRRPSTPGHRYTVATRVSKLPTPPCLGTETAPRYTTISKSSPITAARLTDLNAQGRQSSRCRAVHTSRQVDGAPQHLLGRSQANKRSQPRSCHDQPPQAAVESRKRTRAKGQSSRSYVFRRRDGRFGRGAEESKRTARESTATLHHLRRPQGGQKTEVQSRKRVPTVSADAGDNKKDSRERQYAHPPTNSLSSERKHDTKKHTKKTIVLCKQGRVGLRSTTLPVEFRNNSSHPPGRR